MDLEKSIIYLGLDKLFVCILPTYKEIEDIENINIIKLIKIKISKFRSL